MCRGCEESVQENLSVTFQLTDERDYSTSLSVRFAHTNDSLSFFNLP